MTNYEVLYIISPKADDNTRNELIAKFEGIVTSAGGTATVNAWGMRKLAYDINFVSEGYYVLMDFSAPETTPAELERQMRITDSVLRFIVTKKISNKHTRAAEARRAEIAKQREEARAAEAAKAEAAAKEAAEKEEAENEVAAPEAEEAQQAPAVEPEAVEVSEPEAAAEQPAAEAAEETKDGE
ncbi:MAG: 30S ribosomal protein S6 [Clostridia bacterium]|nr:30S ribosomal protein S6 [Clostridia bacterium]